MTFRNRFVWLAVPPLALCISISASGDLPRLAGTVARVVDGDTIDVQLASGPIRVRLHGIDTPESGQPWGREAKAALTALVLDHKVELEPFEQDRYDRMIARVFVADREVNGALIEQGHAWAYRRYMTKDDTAYCRLEALGASSSERTLESEAGGSGAAMAMAQTQAGPRVIYA